MAQFMGEPRGLIHVNSRKPLRVSNHFMYGIRIQAMEPIVTAMLRILLLAAGLVFTIFTAHAVETITVYKDPS
jgi:hypothetical protein